MPTSLGNVTRITTATTGTAATEICAAPTGTSFRRIGLIALELSASGRPYVELYDGTTAVAFWSPSTTVASGTTETVAIDVAPSLAVGQSLRVRGLAGIKAIVSYTDYLP